MKSIVDLHNKSMNHVHTLLQSKNPKALPLFVANMTAVGTGAAAVFVDLFNLSLVQPAGLLAKLGMGTIRLVTWSHIGQPTYERLPGPTDWLKTLKKVALLILSEAISLCAAFASFFSSIPSEKSVAFQTHFGCFKKELPSDAKLATLKQLQEDQAKAARDAALKQLQEDQAKAARDAALKQLQEDQAKAARDAALKQLQEEQAKAARDAALKQLQEEQLAASAQQLLDEAKRARDVVEGFNQDVKLIKEVKKEGSLDEMERAYEEAKRVVETAKAAVAKAEEQLLLFNSFTPRMQTFGIETMTVALQEFQKETVQLVESADANRVAAEDLAEEARFVLESKREREVPNSPPATPQVRATLATRFWKRFMGGSTIQPNFDSSTWADSES